jgi:hypothetical protein
MHIELIYNFGVDDEPRPCKVLASFMPDEIIGWDNQEGSKVEFYPFLIVVENIDTKESCIWSPYWHVFRHPNGTIERKYGQYASFVNIDSYLSTEEAKNEKC